MKPPRFPNLAAYAWIVFGTLVGFAVMLAIILGVQR